KMLGGKTPAEFALLPEEERKKLYRDRLWLPDEPIHVRDGDHGPFSDPEMANRMMLLQEYNMGRDEVGKRLVKEARDFYYTENSFVVPSERMGDFVQGTLLDGKPKSWVARDLRYLSKFTNATWIEIEIWVGGTMDGMDLRTQQKIKELSGIVKELIDQFGDAIAISKASADGIHRHDIRPYWNPPTAAAKEKLGVDKACSFEELMRIQIEAWTSEVP
ncbi:hypothetical protein DL98DRAFT_398978, partial [Cadophora sp. DSE1049]